VRALAAPCAAGPDPLGTPAEIVVPHGTVLLVAGLPGAGKTTFLRRAVRDPAVRVLDSDDVRRDLQRRLGATRGALLLRPLVHLGHALRVVRAVRAGGDVVVHETGTRPRLRRALARLAGGVGRPCHALLIDAAPEEARAGQRARGRRPVRERVMRRHVRAWTDLRDRVLRDPQALAAEGWATARVLDRAQAASVAAVVFA